MGTDNIERISAIATRSCHERLLLVDQNLIDIKARDAATSTRRREIHNFHINNNDTLQRMLNAIQPGSYIAPHRHSKPPKAETIVILQGSLGYVPFDDAGTPFESEFMLLDSRHGCFAVDTRGGLWHTFFALEEDTVVFEVKPGPYDPHLDKDFAPWAPAEGTIEALDYLKSLENKFRKVYKLSERPWNS